MGNDASSAEPGATPVRMVGRFMLQLCAAAVVIIILHGVWDYFYGWRTGPRPHGPRTRAQSTALTICNAVEVYQMYYDHVPRPVSGVTGHDWDTDSGESEQIISILKGLELNQNPRKTDYLGDIREAELTKSGHLNGILRNRDSVAIVDPWGSPYRIRLDGDGDGFVADPANPGARLKEIVIVWSAGKDGDPATWEDNVSSWSR